MIRGSYPSLDRIPHHSTCCLHYLLGVGEPSCLRSSRHLHMKHDRGSYPSLDRIPHHSTSCMHYLLGVGEPSCLRLSLHLHMKHDRGSYPLLDRIPHLRKRIRATEKNKNISLVSEKSQTKSFLPHFFFWLSAVNKEPTLELVCHCRRARKDQGRTDNVGY